MGVKLMWTGLAFIESVRGFDVSSKFVVAGAIIMVLGCILMWLEK